jgi:hypothetical protein
MDQRRTVTIKFFFSALEAAKLFTPRRAAVLRQSPSIARHTNSRLLDFARSLERFDYFRSEI